MLFVFIVIIILAALLFWKNYNITKIPDDLNGYDTYYNNTHAYVTGKGLKICFPHTPSSLNKIKKHKQLVGTD